MSSSACTLYHWSKKTQDLKELPCILLLLSLHEEMLFSLQIGKSGQSKIVANESMILNRVHLFYCGKCILMVYLIGLCKTFCNNLALYLSIEPSVLCLTVNAYLHPTSFFQSRNLTRFHMLVNTHLHPTTFFHQPI
jgi:hypothetical protein